MAVILYITVTVAPDEILNHLCMQLYRCYLFQCGIRWL